MCNMHKHKPLDTNAFVLPSDGQPPYPASTSGVKRKQLPCYLIPYDEMLAEDFRKAQHEKERNVQDIGERVILLGIGDTTRFPKTV